jgi:hypothetical protein
MASPRMPGGRARSNSHAAKRGGLAARLIGLGLGLRMVMRPRNSPLKPVVSCTPSVETVR